MFKKIKCDNCNNTYDEAFDECPECHKKNGKLDPNFKHITMLSYLKQAGLFVMGLGGFEILGLIISLILYQTGVIDRNFDLAKMLLNTLVYATLFCCLLGIVNIDIKKLFKGFKSWRPYVAAIMCLLMIIIVTDVYLIIAEFAGADIASNTNQGEIDKTVLQYPLTSVVIFGLIGPICEELTYRVGLFSFLKRISKWIAYPVTVIVFALIHFDFEAESIVNELLNLPCYLLAGFFLTYTYDKYGFAASTTAHILNNVISLIPMLISAGVFH